jgi:SAM-dependent methyltransferase
MALNRPARALELLPLFLVSLATVGFEIALTRYFAVAKWSEYGYWVISIVLAGFALSGVVIALARDRFAAAGPMLLAWLPPVLIVAAAIGFHFVTTNPFNPLQLQNPATFEPQLWNIAGYYLALLPFFFLAGLYVSLFFILHDREIGRVYGYDLTGAGLGALAVLALMWVVHPFHLVPCLLLPLAAAAWRHRLPLLVAGLALLAGAGLLLLDDQAGFNEYKAIYAPSNVPDSQEVAEHRSPRGLYMLLDDFTERVDTDLSNNAGMLNLPGPPPAFGLYRDGNRIAALPKPGKLDTRYAPATLAALPYTLRTHASVLLAGTSGGFRIGEVRTLGAARILALEPEPVLRAALRNGLGPAPAAALGAGVTLGGESPIAAAAAHPAGFDIIDLSADFLDTAEANTSAFAAEALTSYLRALKPGGLVSIPASIREFPAYAVRVLATARAGLLAAGYAHPERHVLVYRSAWNVRVLLSNTPFTAAEIAAARKFCDDRSFDISYFPGIDVAAARAGIYNDLPAVSFEAGQVTSGAGPHDAIADEALPILLGHATESARAFNLAPITYDRPSFYAVLRLAHLGTILQRLEILPQAEIGPLVNLAVLAQALVIALIVLAAPLLARMLPGHRRLRAPGGGTIRAVIYFAALGLGFLFVEIFAIERASFYLNDRTSGFALVLTGMLIFSGLGAMLAHRFRNPRTGMWLAAGVIVVWGALLLAFLQPAMLASLALPWPLRAAIVLLVVAPVSIALGLPFPLGLSRTGSGGFLPWAWGLNGAFSVISTPLANLTSLEFGYDRVLLSALLLYVICALAFPRPLAGESAS